MSRIESKTYLNIKYNNYLNIKEAGNKEAQSPLLEGGYHNSFYVLNANILRI